MLHARHHNISQMDKVVGKLVRGKHNQTLCEVNNIVSLLQRCTCFISHLPFTVMHVKGLPLCIEHINASRLTHRGHVELYETFQVLIDLNLSYTKFLFRLNVMLAF